MKKMFSTDLNKYCKNCGAKMIFQVKNEQDEGEDTYTLTVEPQNGKCFIYHDNSNPPYYLCYRCLHD